jgi:putative membrane protein
MLKLGTALTMLVISSALVHCSQKSSPPPASPEPATTAPPPTTAPSESMAPASGTTGPSEPSASSPMPAASPETAAPAPSPLSDAQIVQIVVLANTAEVDQAKIAQRKAKNARVKKFAAMMVSDHNKAKQKATKLGVEPAESTLSTELTAESQSMLSALEGAAPADFDRKYIDSQVDAHKKVLSTVNERLLPAASDPKLKSLLEEIRTTVDAHLTEAEKIQGELASAAP